MNLKSEKLIQAFSIFKHFSSTYCMKEKNRLEIYSYAHFVTGGVVDCIERLFRFGNFLCASWRFLL